jgi:predicted DNA-binding transcriptional regulator YafY
VIGYQQFHRKITTLALDRIKNITVLAERIFIPNTFFDPVTYYKNTLGVTVFTESEPERILLYIYPTKMPYIETKPFHASQKTIVKLSDGSGIIELHLRLNFELRDQLLALGSQLLVISPTRLRKANRRKCTKRPRAV